MNESPVAPRRDFTSWWTGLSVVILALVVGTCVLSVLVFVVVNRLFESNSSQQRQDARTECVRNIANDIADKRWGDIADILQASQARDAAGVRAGTAKLEATKGEQDRRIAQECPQP